MGNAQGGSDESRNRKAARKLRKKAEPLFGKYDTDNDGVLTEEQMEQFLEEIYALTGLPSDNTHKASRLNEWKRVFGWSTSLSIDELRDVLKFVGGPTREVQDDNSSSNSYVGPEGGIDEPLNTIMDKISVHQNIQGVVVSDTLGYCIAARGNLDSAAAGFLQSILDSAIRLSEDEEYPIISIETDKRTILVSHTDGFTTSILRSHQGDEHKDHQ